MNHYAGLDVSLEKTAICTFNEDGLVIRERVVAGDPAAIAQALSGAWVSKPAHWRPGSMQVSPI